MGERFPKKVGNNVYPRPEYCYPDVKIGLTWKDSVADFPRPLQAPEGSPNVLSA
jgi:arylsulfatase